MNSHLSLVRNLSQKASRTIGDEKHIVVYQGRLEKDIFRVKVFSMSTSVLGLVFQPILYQYASSLPLLIGACSVAGFFTFVTPVLLHQLTKKHVNRVTYNEAEDTYTAHTTTFFFQKRQIPIAPGELKVPDNPGVFTTLEIRGIPLMIEMSEVDKKHLIRLLGYDKPLENLDKFATPLEIAQKKQEEARVSSAVTECKAEDRRRSCNRQ